MIVTTNNSGAETEMNTVFTRLVILIHIFLFSYSPPHVNKNLTFRRDLRRIRDLPFVFGFDVLGSCLSHSHGRLATDSCVAGKFGQGGQLSGALSFLLYKIAASTNKAFEPILGEAKFRCVEGIVIYHNMLWNKSAKGRFIDL